MSNTFVHGREIRDLRVTKGTGLTVGIASGNYNVAGIEGFYAGVSNQAVSDNSTNYIEMDSSGTISVNTSGFTSGLLHLAIVTTSSGAITDVDDSRVFVTNAGAGIGAAVWRQGEPTGTIDGVNDEFTLPDTPDPNSLLLALDGKLLDQGGSDDYTLSADTITFNTPPETGSKITYFYTLSTPVSPAPARDLQSATTVVNIDASAAPTANQVLVAIDDENAEWQDNFAQGLINATTGVDISASAAPSAGQVMVATSSTTMEWTNARPYTWSTISGTSASLAVNTAYIANNGSLVVGTLPATAPVGSVIVMQGLGAGGWRIAQNAGQNIIFQGSSSTVGAGGRLDSADQYDSVTLVCIVANTTFAVMAHCGTPTLT